MAERRQQNDRRATSERRRRDRRRKNDARVFVVEVTSSDLRIALLDRGVHGGADQATAWTSRWRKDAASLESPEGLAELTAALREAARLHNMYTADVRGVLGGEFCVIRTVRGGIDEVRAELQQLEQRSRLYLALGPGEKVLVSHTKLLDARHAHAVAAACNRATLEAVQTAAENAGLELSLIEPALSAITRAVSRLPDLPTGPYLLINLTESATEIAIIHEGRLLLDYRPGGATKPHELASLLDSHINRLNRHVARHLRTSLQLQHVFLCGDGAALEAAAKSFGAKSALDVRLVRPQDVQATWTLSQGAAEAATAPVLGGLLAAYLPAEDSDAPNLMQHILEGRLEPLRPRLLRSAEPIAAVLLIALGLGWVNSRRQAELDSMQAELDGLAASAARATELRLQLSASESKLRELEKLASTLPQGLGATAIRGLGACMPSDVWLSQLAIADRGHAQVQGASYIEAGVYEFVRFLEQSPGFSNVALKRTSATTIASGPATSFELELELGKSNDQAERVARHE
jgi:Tfp pilus assembly PilM family ATPase/Tfp pilus assembly protein PilN